jgi:hypothetical protein
MIPTTEPKAETPPAPPAEVKLDPIPKLPWYGPCWEYCGGVFRVSETIAKLNQLGSDGWEAFGFSQQGAEVAILLKRPLARSTSQTAKTTVQKL